MRWGTNVVYQTGTQVLGTRSFSTNFSQSGQTSHEAQAAAGDSGGAVFAKKGATWKLAGIIFTVAGCQEGSAIFGDLTYSADLSFYFDQIDEVASVPACDDGTDQDGDGLADYPDDPGCDDELDSFETSDALPCDDGIDNDGDGRVDFDPDTFADFGDETTPPSGSGDPGCFDPSWFTESPKCQDGIHNDGDGRMDYDAGLSANGFADSAGPDPQCIGAPWANAECGLGAELALVLPLLIWLRRRRRRGL
jgi:hypothetical protein